MAEWRLARGWSDAELSTRLAQAAHLERNFVVTGEFAPETGWNRHASEAVIARERPGAPEAEGAFVRAWAFVQAYAFSDPRIVRAHFDRDGPLLERRMLLEIRVLGLHYLTAVIVGAVQTRDEGRRTVRGFRYDTLEGHVERGCEWFLIEKDHASGEVTFRIRAAWQPGELPNWWSRLGFRLLARRYQRAWHRLAHLRLRAMIGARDLEPLPRGRRLVHAGPDLPIAAVQVTAAGRRAPDIAQERDEAARGPGAPGLHGFVARTYEVLTVRDMNAAFGIGVVTGGRSLLGPALVARWLAQRPHPQWMDGAARVLPLLSMGELVADKTRFVGARTDAAPLVGRLVFGALTGAAVVAPERRKQGAVAGALGAAAGAFGLFALRRRLTSRGGLPDGLVGLCEDVVLLTAGFWILRGAARTQGSLRAGRLASVADPDAPANNLPIDHRL